MTCYLRHLAEILRKAGIEVTPENKRDLDKVIHSLVNVTYKNCSATWKAVKMAIAENESDFVSQLQEAWNKYIYQFYLFLTAILVKFLFKTIVFSNWQSLIPKFAPVDNWLSSQATPLLYTFYLMYSNHAHNLPAHMISRNCSCHLRWLA